MDKSSLPAIWEAVEDSDNCPRKGGSDANSSRPSTCNKGANRKVGYQLLSIDWWVTILMGILQVLGLLIIRHHYHCNIAENLFWLCYWLLWTNDLFTWQTINFSECLLQESCLWYMPWFKLVLICVYSGIQVGDVWGQSTLGYGS